MAHDPDFIVVPGTGRVLTAPTGTAFPADVATAFSATWRDLGGTTEDGVQLTKSKTTEGFRPWQSFRQTRRWITELTERVSFTLSEWSNVTVEMAFEGAITEPTAGNYVFTPASEEEVLEYAIAVEWVDDTKIYRLYVPRMMTAEDMETTFSRQGPSLLPITLEALGEDGTAPYTIHSNDPSWEPPV